MKAFLILMCSLLSYTVQAQIVSYRMLYVEVEDQMQFEELARERAQVRAQNLVDTDSIIYWGLEKFRFPQGTISGKPNLDDQGNWYQYVMVHKNQESYAKVESWWQTALEDREPPIRKLPIQISYKEAQLWQIQDQIFEQQNAKFSWYHFRYSDDLQEFLDNQKSFIINAEKQKISQQEQTAGWVFSSHIDSSNWAEPNVLTWVGFLNFPQALYYQLNAELDVDYDEFDIFKEFAFSVICEKILETEASK